MGNKYGAKKVIIDGITFASKKEGERYSELKLLERAGEISDLQLQVKFLLIPAQRELDSIGRRGGVKKGRTIEQECTYVADFVYTDKSGNKVVEDVKGYRDPSSAAYAKFVIKRKLMLYRYGIRVREV